MKNQVKIKTITEIIIERLARWIIIPAIKIILLVLFLCIGMVAGYGLCLLLFL